MTGSVVFSASLRTIKIIQDYLMNKFIPAADPAMKSHHDTDIFWILYILVTKMSRMSNQKKQYVVCY